MVRNTENKMKELESNSPIQNKVGSIFVPVRDLEQSRNWYCKLLGISIEKCSILNGHLCPLPMQGTGIILDTMPRWGGEEADGVSPITAPAFMLLTDDLEAAYNFVKETRVHIVTAIENDYWFVIKDPDGNLLMICKA